MHLNFHHIECKQNAGCTISAVWCHLPFVRHAVVSVSAVVWMSTTVQCCLLSSRYRIKRRSPSLTSCLERSARRHRSSDWLKPCRICCSSMHPANHRQLLLLSICSSSSLEPTSYLSPTTSNQSLPLTLLFLHLSSPLPSRVHHFHHPKLPHCFTLCSKPTCSRNHSHHRLTRTVYTVSRHRFFWTYPVLFEFFHSFCFLFFVYWSCVVDWTVHVKIVNIYLHCDRKNAHLFHMTVVSRNRSTLEKPQSYEKGKRLLDHGVYGSIYLTT